MATRKLRPVLYELVKRNPPPSARPVATTPGTDASPARESPPPTPAPPRAAPSNPERESEPVRRGVAPRLGPPLNGRPRSAAAVVVMNRLLRHVGGPGGVVIAVVVVFALLAIWQSLVYLRNQSAPLRDANASIAPAAPAPAVPALAGGGGRATPPAGDPPRSLPPRAPAPSAEDRPAPDAGAKPEPVEPAPAVAPAPATRAPLVLEKGRHYVVVQHFRASEREAAGAATAYLQSHGVAVALDESPREFRLIALEPFLLDQKDAAARQREQKRVDVLKQQIRALGREYARTAGYAFDQCYERKF
ncbi:MAG: hypothetical protein AB7Q17_04235 [Phycisphaerae bacterium]